MVWFYPISPNPILRRPGYRDLNPNPNPYPNPIRCHLVMDQANWDQANWDQAKWEDTDGLLDPKSIYNIIWKDRNEIRGGDVCAFVKRCYSVVPIILLDKCSELELIGIDFVDFKPTVRMFVVYRPPYYDHNAVLYTRLLVVCLRYYSTNRKYMHLVTGDFNLPHIDWDVFTGPDDDINHHHHHQCSILMSTQTVS